MNATLGMTVTLAASLLIGCVGTQPSSKSADAAQGAGKEDTCEYLAQTFAKSATDGFTVSWEGLKVYPDDPEGPFSISLYGLDETTDELQSSICDGTTQWGDPEAAYYSFPLSAEEGSRTVTSPDFSGKATWVEVDRRPPARGFWFAMIDFAAESDDGTIDLRDIVTESNLGGDTGEVVP